MCVCGISLFIRDFLLLLFTFTNNSYAFLWKYVNNTAARGSLHVGTGRVFV